MLHPRWELLSFCALAACGGENGPTTPAGGGAIRLPMAMVAHVDGHDYLAGDSIGFGAQFVDINKEGILLSARFLNSSADAPVNSGDFQLTVTGMDGATPVAPHVEYTSLEPFGGSLYWIAPGQAVSAWLGLYHVSAGHYDFGPYPLVIKRRARSIPPPALSSP